VNRTASQLCKAQLLQLHHHHKGGLFILLSPPASSSSPRSARLPPLRIESGHQLRLARCQTYKRLGALHWGARSAMEHRYAYAESCEAAELRTPEACEPAAPQHALGSGVQRSCHHRVRRSPTVAAGGDGIGYALGA